MMGPNETTSVAWTCTDTSAHEPGELHVDVPTGATFNNTQILLDGNLKLVKEGADIETVARAVSALRNELRLRAYDGDPEGLEAVKASNLAAYGDENGPTADSLFEKYGSWETVLEKAFSVNSGMDACLGLYDAYYGLYCLTGQVDDPEYLYEQRLLSMLDYFADDLTAYLVNPALPCTRGHAVTLLWVLSACPQPQDAAAETFSDIPHSSVYYLPVQWAKEAGVTCGTPGSVFAPDMLLTRAQMVTFLMRMTAPDYEAQTEVVFADVPEDAYYREAVLWALENGITYGTSETTFSPDMICNRGHIVTFLYRYANGQAGSRNNPFTDVKAGEYYENPVLWAVEKKITTGKTATTFAPADDCTRGQIVTFMWRLAK